MFYSSKVFFTFYYRQIQETRKEILQEFSQRNNLYSELKTSTDGFGVIASYFGKGLFSEIPDGEPEYTVKEEEPPSQKESADNIFINTIPDVPEVVTNPFETEPEVPEVVTIEEPPIEIHEETPEDKSYLDKPLGSLDTWGMKEATNPFGDDDDEVATNPENGRSREKCIFNIIYSIKSI